jgi:replication-associated recombination protein RarA
VANATGGAFVKLNAVTAGVKELRAIVEEAERASSLPPADISIVGRVSPLE